MRDANFGMALTGALAVSLGLWATATFATPKVILISLDGAKPDVIEKQLESGALDKRTGIGRLKRPSDSPGPRPISPTPAPRLSLSSPPPGG
ncbi:MAG: hypothetical protein ACREVZ_16980 [Burkholderiales bacterium]